MKLNLESQKNISILSASGTIQKREVTLLFAGIKKLFRDGKHRIVLELPDVTAMDSDDLRELVKLNLLAAELSGEIVLSSIDEKTQLRIAGFSSPPFMKCFKDRSSAIAQFSPKPEELALPVNKVPPISHAKASDGKPDATREEFRHREITELGPLRKQIERLQKENDALAEQLQSSLFAYREPSSADQWKKKIETLEVELGRLLQKTP